MGRQPCCDKVGLKKGPWAAEEDKKLINFILNNGQCCWRAVPKLAGLLRCGKSCRLRWTNYLRPDLKRGLLSEYEEKMVIDLHAQLGNRWSKIASHLSGRTDNEIKNHWNTHIKKKLRKMGIDPLTHKPLPTTIDEQPIKGKPHNNSNNRTPAPAQQSQNNQNKELGIETSISSVQSTITDITTHNKELEDKNSSSNSMLAVATRPFEFDSMEVNNGFCTDEVPLIELEPNEILVPCDNSNNIPSSSICSSSSSSSTSSSNNMLEDLELFMPTFDWNCDLGFWLDEFSSSSSLDMLINGECDSNNNILATADEPPTMSQYQTMVSLDEDYWKFDLL